MSGRMESESSMLTDPESGMLTRPDWVMVGVRSGSRFLLYASKSLIEADLRLVIRAKPVIWRGRPHVTSARSVILSGAMADYVMVEADSYGQALAHLSEKWRPDADAPDLTGRREIEQ